MVQIEDDRERRRDKERVAFREFSEKVVSDHCAGILESTLDRLDNVRDSVLDHLQVKESNDLLEPVLAPLSRTLAMNEHFYYKVELTEEEIEEYKDKEEEEEEKKRDPSLFSPTELENPQNETARRERQLNRVSRSWTEENEPQLLFKFRLRRLEKSMALFPYALRFAPDPVREELEVSGFVQQTKTLREAVRSLLTCEGVSHVTVAQLEDVLGGHESDNYMDRDATRRAVSDFSNEYYYRLLNYLMNARNASMRPSRRTANGPQNATQVEDRVPIKKPSEDRQQLKEQGMEDQSLFATPNVKFAWTWEAVVRLWKATEEGQEKNPEVTAVLFQG